MGAAGSMKRPYQIAGIVLTLFAALMVYQSSQVPFYTRLGPGPGFFPLWVSLFLGALGLTMLLQATFTDQPMMPIDFFPQHAGRIRLCSMLCSFVFLTGAMDWLGFRITMFVFVVFLLVTINGVGRWIGATLAGSVVSVGMHYAFTYWLRIHLPVGALGF